MAAPSSAASPDASTFGAAIVPHGEDISTTFAGPPPGGVILSAGPPSQSPGQSTLLKDIEALRKRQRELKVCREQMARELKNAMRRKKRLRARARQLSNEDLLMVVAMRADFQSTKGIVSRGSNASTRAGSSRDACGSAVSTPPEQSQDEGHEES